MTCSDMVVKTEPHTRRNRIRKKSNTRTRMTDTTADAVVETVFKMQPWTGKKHVRASITVTGKKHVGASITVTGKKPS